LSFNDDGLREVSRDFTVNKDSNHRSNDNDDSISRPANSRPMVSFEDISEGAAEILIECDGQTYHLRKTRNGRLVLNK
jgi:hemin uptake protein HemP